MNYSYLYDTIDILKIKEYVMRTLTVKREKSFVACLMKVKIYIEDAQSSEITINGVPCRWLGELKNGEEKTFEIEERAAKVFVIADKLSKELCNEFYPIPEGSEDISISGKNHYNPAKGNPFYFNGVEDGEVLANRKKNSKRGIIITVAAIAVGIVLGLLIALLPLLKEASPKTFSKSGMSITLTDDFEEESMDGFTACYDSNDVAVFALKEGFDLMDGFDLLTLNEYAEMVINTNSVSCEVKSVDTLTYFDYTSTPSDTEYYYFVVLYKAEDAFWIVQFVTPEKNADEYKDSFIDWAKTVKFE